MNLKAIKRAAVAALAATAILGSTATTADARVLGTQAFVTGIHGEFVKYVPPNQGPILTRVVESWGADCVLFDTRYDAHAWARVDPNRKWVVWTLGYAACNRGGRL